MGDLVGRGVLPRECFVFVGGGTARGGEDSGEGDVRTGPASKKVVMGGYVSPRLVNLKRGLERERVKDGLRGWLVGGRVRMEMEKRGREEEMRKEKERSVKGLVRRFAGKKGEDGARGKGAERESRWGRGAVVGEKRKRGEPTRAHVYGLRRFWEGVGREAMGS